MGEAANGVGASLKPVANGVVYAVNIVISIAGGGCSRWIICPASIDMLP